MSSSADSERRSRYRTRLAPRALKDVEAVYAYIASESPRAAERWVIELFEAVANLSTLPYRFPRAPEDSEYRIGLRHVILGSYRILFLVDEDRREVSVPHVRHASRAPLPRGDLDSSAI